MPVLHSILNLINIISLFSSRYMLTYGHIVNISQSAVMRTHLKIQLRILGANSFSPKCKRRGARGGEFRRTKSLLLNVIRLPRGGNVFVSLVAGRNLSHLKF